jgi:transposase
MSKEIKGKRYGRLYLESYKKEVVRSIEEEGSIILICDRLGLGRSTVAGWLKQYGSAAYHSRKPLRHNSQERNRVARQILSGQISIEEAMLKYQLNRRNTVTEWVREYKKDQQLLPNVLTEEQKTGSPVSTPSSQELQLAQLKIRALETMLDIASKEFNTDIRKKFGAKQ